MLGFVGVTAIEERVAFVTVSVVFPETSPSVAVIVVVPAATDVAKPCDRPGFVYVATPASEELQATWVVRSCVVLSLKVPVAVNCRVVPFVRVGVAGVTVIVDRVAAVTVSVVLPETPPKVAVIVVVPAATDVAKPFEPPALLIVTTAAAEGLQATWVVRTCVVLSLKVPVAVNCWVNPSGRPGSVGVTAIETRVALVTVSVAQVFVVVQLTLPSVAVIVMGPPAATDVARPFDPLA